MKVKKLVLLSTTPTLKVSTPVLANELPPLAMTPLTLCPTKSFPVPSPSQSQAHAAWLADFEDLRVEHDGMHADEFNLVDAGRIILFGDRYSLLNVQVIGNLARQDHCVHDRPRTVICEVGNSARRTASSSLASPMTTTCTVCILSSLS